MINVGKKVKPNDFRQLEINLRTEYQKSLQTVEFQEFVKKIPLSEDILMEYTSTLEDSLKEYQQCQNCKSIMECQNQIEGYAYLPKINDQKLEFSYRSCRFKEKQRKQNKHLKNMKFFHAPRETEEAMWERVDKTDKNRHELIRWLTEFILAYGTNKQLKGLYLNGSFGSGKSYLITAMFHHLAEQGTKCAIVFWPQYLRDLKASFDTDYQVKYDAIMYVPLLLIDDVGAESTTAWARDEILCPILQYRMDQHLPTFFTSNLDLLALEQHLAVSKNGVEEVKAKRIISRIEQLTDSLELVSKNLRK